MTEAESPMSPILAGSRGSVTASIYEAVTPNPSSTVLKQSNLTALE